MAAWADRGGRRSNPNLIDIDSTAEAIGLALAEGSHAYDYAIIDTPPSQMDLIDEAIAQASFVLIPCRASALDLTALDPVVEMCREHEKEFAFVFNAVHPERKILKSAPGVLRKRGPLCETMIVDRAAYVAAMTVGKGRCGWVKVKTAEFPPDAAVTWAAVSPTLASNVTLAVLGYVSLGKRVKPFVGGPLRRAENSALA